MDPVARLAAICQFSRQKSESGGPAVARFVYHEEEDLTLAQLSF
jgi:hypothetical protein